MTLALGVLLGTGVCLVASPWLWPTAAGRAGSPGPAERVRGWLARAGFERVPVAVFVVLCTALGVAAGSVVAALLPVPALAVLAAGVGALVPVAVVSSRGRARRRMLRAAWPDLVDHLVSAIRSGRSLGDAVAGLAEVGPAELRTAFADLGRAVESTGLLDPAFDDLKRRLGDPVADRIVETLRLAREVGGTELPSVLRALAAALRQDAAVRSEVEARQSWVVNAARLGVAAPWVVLLLLSARSEAAAAYNSPAGLALLGVGAVVSVVAYRIMVALGRLPDERRWFA
ncbi:MAG: type II secretion system F family protein [Microbacteriaceae bacterium]|nr:type II secretion system F family protein [Microbacteriaceae bacterium]